MAHKNEILRYALLPGIIPRFMALFRSGFAHIAFLMAVIYSNVRLLPANHPYLRAENFGRYGIRHVIAEASNNLVFTRNNLDQILIFFTILTGLMLIVVQFALLIVAIMAEQPAFALAVTDLFANPGGTTGSLGPDQDLAFAIMDRVFGIEGYFNSCVSNLTVPCTDMYGQAMSNTPTVYPFPFHDALHMMLQFYSTGIFLVGVFVIIYYVITIVAETAATGTPFGQRFNKAWAPVRLILFFALIIPINMGGGANEGFNGAQLITFKIVQMGSNMATNGWAYFNTSGTDGGLSGSYASQQYDIVAAPKIPEVNDLLKTIFLARACAVSYALKRGPNGAVDAFLIRSPAPSGITTTVNGPGALTPNAIELATTNYGDALDFSYQGSIIVRFGILGTEDPDNPGNLTQEYNAYKGNVKPTCGEILLPISGDAEPGANTIYSGYYGLINAIWTDTDFITRSECLAERHIAENQDTTCTNLPDTTWAMGEIGTYTGQVRTIVQNGINDQRTAGAFNVPPEVLERGWVGAAIWYNKIASMNGAVTTATLGIPKATRLPLLMDIAVQSNTMQSEFVRGTQRFSQRLADETGFNAIYDFDDEGDREMLNVMDLAHDFWVNEGGAQESNLAKTTGNIIIDFINVVLGTSGLFEMRDNTDVHPLAQLSSLGKGMMEATVRNAVGGAALSIAGAALESGSSAKVFTDSASSFLFAMVVSSIGIAVILYYVLPLLPFIYFMFAVSGWVKSIFEAIVALPLWALAHLRIDGEGIPGPGASNGYFLLLEIFIRPILIIFGFLASITIFAALVNVLNQIFDIVVGNVGGYDSELEANIATGAVTGLVSALDVSRSPVDEFFFTAMYAIICYLIGLACFKLVDLIPNNILRWMGVSVSTFQENAGDPAGQLTSNVYRGSLLVGNQVEGTMKGVRSGGDLPIILS